MKHFLDLSLIPKSDLHHILSEAKRRKAKQAGRKRWQKKQEKLQAERGY